MGITEILRRIWLFSANKIKSSESVSKQPTQLIIELNSSLPQKFDTLNSTYFLSILLLSNDAIVLAPRPNSENSTPTLSLSFLIDFDFTGGWTCSGFLATNSGFLATFCLSSLKTKMEMACSFKFPTKAFASRVFSSSSLIFNLLLTSEKWKQGTLAFSLLRIQHHLYTCEVWFIRNLREEKKTNLTLDLKINPLKFRFMESLRHTAILK